MLLFDGPTMFVYTPTPREVLPVEYWGPSMNQLQGGQTQCALKLFVLEDPTDPLHALGKYRLKYLV